MGKTPAEIIEDKGGPLAFAQALGAPKETVRVWKHRNQFPRLRWPEIAQAFPELDQEALLAAERLAKERAAAAAGRPKAA